MKKAIVFSLVLIVAILFLISFLNYKKIESVGRVIDEQEDKETVSDDRTRNNTRPLDIEDADKKRMITEEDTYRKNAVEKDNETEKRPPNIELPYDIDSVECGFYFEEYGLCRGTCPEGSCVSEGRSCYCKKLG